MKLLQLTGEIVSEAILAVLYFAENNLRNFGHLIDLLLPSGMLFLGMYAYKFRGEFAAGAEIFLPVLFMLVSYYCKRMANKLGKGDTFPVPEKRFTSEDDDGNPEIEVDRIQELILYIADVEEWLSRKGYMRK